MPNTLSSLLSRYRFLFAIALSLSIISNLFILTVTINTLWKLDRLIGTENFTLDTLCFIISLIIVLYILLYILQESIPLILTKLETSLNQKLYQALVINSAEFETTQNNLQIIKNFLTSNSLSRLFDIPWSIIYTIILFIVHPLIGALSLSGTALLLSLALINIYINSRNVNQVRKKSGKNYMDTIILAISWLIRVILQLSTIWLGAYLITTSPLDITIGGVIFSSMIMWKSLISFDKMHEILEKTKDAVKSYKSLITIQQTK